MLSKSMVQNRLLIVNPMEVEEAKKSGYAYKSYKELGVYSPMYICQHKNASNSGRHVYRPQVLSPGRIGIYGQGKIEVYSELVPIGE